MTLRQTAIRLAQARSNGTRLEDYPEHAPRSLAEAYQIQDLVIEAMGQAVIGWKVGFTSATAREAAGIAEPLSGPIFASSLYPDGASVPVGPQDLKILEAEIGFKLGSDLAPREKAYERVDILAAIANVHPMFELVGKRLPGDLKESPEWIAADGTINQAIICGTGVPYSPDMDLPAEAVRVLLNGETHSTGIGANAMGDPVGVLVWLANHMSERDIGLKAGDLIATGLVSDLIYCQQGDQCRAEFASLGSLSMRLEG